jgi:hypothetical protein
MPLYDWLSPQAKSCSAYLLSSSTRLCCECFTFHPTCWVSGELQYILVAWIMNLLASSSFCVDLYKVMIRNSEYDVVVAWNLCLSRNDPKLWMLCGCMKSMPVSLHFGLKLGVSLLMLKPISHFPWFWNRCLLISSMSLLFSGFLSTQLLFILCLMS